MLENCLSYDEMKLSAMVYVSGHTECINDGSRTNAGVIREDIAEEDAVIIGNYSSSSSSPSVAVLPDVTLTGCDPL